MVVMMKLKYVDELSGGRKRFRRRYPKAVAEALGEVFFQVPMKAREGAALVAEQERLVAAFEKIVSKAQGGAGQVSLREHWRDALREAQAMLEAISGDLSEDDKREVLADDLHRKKADPVLVKAVAAPQSEEPPATLLDAKEMYRRERMDGAEGRNQKNRLERVCRRMEGALGPLDKLPLVNLKREHGRELRDHMLQAPAKGKGGKLLSPASVRRELDMVSAMTKLAITEFDLQGQVVNPFEGLSVGPASKAPQTEWERRDPLPLAVLSAMRKRLDEKVKTPELGLIWRILEGTGCRGAEVVGLRVEDVHVEHAYPHIWVRWHEDRRVKTAVSIRQVPLVGDALVAAREALKLAAGHHMLFPRYAREAGPDAVSQALMKHRRAITKYSRHVVYSLRHNMKDLLVAAGVPQRDENRILGHTLGGLGDRVYGGEKARLKAAYEAMERALEGRPRNALIR
ncbi:tyrosine-type recombinase/integrase [uncultured Sulfitobacter sp.]|uniref:tyrosine-type recombinase/integrase n=1 Tax=uncultured Sulfitobacter sp. TaxID=191468 RepID=UPI002632A964|nr:tyrosine-type recombinase/integrase [uncultured Sulfitobacter sp.]